MKKYIWAILLVPGFFASRLTAAPIETSTVTGNIIHFNDETGIAVVEGNAVIVTSTAVLKADKITVDTRNKEGHMEGNVSVEQASGTLTGSEVFYDWEASTGLLFNAQGISPPWSFSSDQMIQLSPDHFKLYRGYITSCDATPPHYQIHSPSADVLTGKRATMKNAHFVVDETTALWLPYYSRSLVPKKYSLRVEPGNSGRDGLIAKTTLGYPITPNTYTNFMWDWYQETGNGFGFDHRYVLPNLHGRFDTYYISDTNPDPQPESRRFDVNWNHYQKFTDKLTGNAVVNFKSDQTFGDQFNGFNSEGRVENQTRGILSESGLNYQFSKASLAAEVRRKDRFDSSVSSKRFIGQLILPSLTFSSIPLTWKKFPFYTSFSASYFNQTQDRLDPNESLLYQESATTGVQMKKDFRIVQKWTATPTLGYLETWQDRDFSQPDSSSDIYQGRANTGIDLRRRFFNLTDLTLNQKYVVRSEKNQMARENSADDRGIETNLFTGSVVTRVGRDSRLTLASGYDFRQSPRSDPEKYEHQSERITSPSADLQWQLSKSMDVYFREIYSLFDSSTKTPRRTPLSTSGELQVTSPGTPFLFTQGFNYSKTNPGEESDVVLNNKLRLYLTTKWYLDAAISYRAVGSGGMNYSKVFPIEKTLRVVRDLHCFILRMEFSKRPDRTEASFYIDLKANLSSARNVFNQAGMAPLVTDVRDINTIFPPENPQPQKTE